jgi:uracil-DNA glycosylase family 4
MEISLILRPQTIPSFSRSIHTRAQRLIRPKGLLLQKTPLQVFLGQAALASNLKCYADLRSLGPREHGRALRKGRGMSEGCVSMFGDHIIREEHTNIPRGFFTQAQPGMFITLLIVAQNPGQPARCERRLYASQTPREAAKTHLGFAEGSFVHGNGKTFHKRLGCWLTDLLGVEISRVFQSVVYTNVVKCTPKRNAVPKSAVAETCAELHLKREISAWRPRLVVALGKGAHNLLNHCGVPHERLPHPSHRRGPEYHRQQLETLRLKLKRI